MGSRDLKYQMLMSCGMNSVLLCVFIGKSCPPKCSVQTLGVFLQFIKSHNISVKGVRKDLMEG